MSFKLAFTTFFELASPLLLIPILFFYGANLFDKKKFQADWSKHFRDLKVLAPYLRSEDKTEALNSLKLLVNNTTCTKTAYGVMM